MDFFQGGYFMREDFLLLFLSPVRFAADGKVMETHYTNLSGENTHMTNESALRYLLENELSGKKLSKIFILASKEVRKEIKNCSEKITHLEYFKNRVGNFLDNVEDCITDETVCDYDEDIGGEYNLKSVAETAKKIQNFAKKSGKEIYLHVDLTGGMRHVNMIILDVIRLLEYSGVKIGKIIYSNYNPTKKAGTVEEINDIYDLIRLISGVEEFINFGSVKILNEYYENHSEEKSVSLKNLLNAMKNFADAIKLCRYGQFKNAIENLHDSIHDFIKNVHDDEKNLNDILMARLIRRINQEYEMLISTRGHGNDLKIIRWCINKGYLQQALTLYTERIPEYLGENGFILQSEKETKILDDLVKKDSMNRNKFFYLLNECIPRKDHLSDGIKKYSHAIKTQAADLIRKDKFDFDEWWREISEYLGQKNISCADEIRLRSQLELLKFLRKDPSPLKNLDSSELNPIREIIDALGEELSKLEKAFLRSKRIIAFIQNELQSKEIKNFFPGLQFAKEIADKYPESFELHEMIIEGIFSVSIPEEKFLSITDKYFRVKNERNHSNHARNDNGEFSSAKELENFMLVGLDEIENVMKEKNI